MTTPALRALARELAPLIAEELGLEPRPTASRPRGRYDERTIAEFLSPLHLGDSVLLRARVFFRHLAQNGRVGSLELVELLDLKGADQHSCEPDQPAQEACRPPRARGAVGGDRRPRRSYGVARPRRHRRPHDEGDRRRDGASWSPLGAATEGRSWDSLPETRWVRPSSSPRGELSSLSPTSSAVGRSISSPANGRTTHRWRSAWPRASTRRDGIPSTSSRGTSVGGERGTSARPGVASTSAAQSRPRSRRSSAQVTRGAARRIRAGPATVRSCGLHR